MIFVYTGLSIFAAFNWGFVWGFDYAKREFINR